jgi:hypothetical protein
VASPVWRPRPPIDVADCDFVVGSSQATPGARPRRTGAGDYGLTHTKLSSAQINLRKWSRRPLRLRRDTPSSLPLFSRFIVTWAASTFAYDQAMAWLASHPVNFSSKFRRQAQRIGDAAIPAMLRVLAEGPAALIGGTPARFRSVIG